MRRRLNLADLSALRIARKAQPRSVTRAARRARAPRQPSAVETLYTGALVKLLREQHAVIKAALRLPDGTRHDALSGPVAVAIARLKTDFLDLITEEHLTDLLTKVAMKADRHSMIETARVIGIKLEDVPGLAQLIARFRVENVALIRSVSTEQLDRVSQVFADASTQGRRVEDIADDVQAQFDVSESRASLIARDQVLKANADMTQARHVAAGITEYIWTSTGDSRVRDEHKKLDGQRFRYDDPPVTNAATGARNPPGRDFQCRCTPDPVIDSLL